MWIKMSKEYDGHKAGDFLEVAEEATARSYIAVGMAEDGGEGPNADLTRQLDASIDAKLDLMARDLAPRLLDKVSRSLKRPNIAGTDGAAVNGECRTITPPDFRTAREYHNWVECQSIEATPEDRTLGDWLQQMSIYACPQHPQHQRSFDKLINKYRTSRFNPGFSGDFRDARWKAVAPDGQQRASAQIETSGPLGGFTVPIEFHTQIIRLIEMRAQLMSRVRRYTMASLQMNIPALDYGGTTSGQSPYLAGMNAAWVAEGQAFPQQNITTRQIELKANMLAGYTTASRTLLADNAVGLEQVLTDLFADAIAFNVDYSILLGTGANQPLGIKNSACTLVRTRTVAAAGSFLADLAAMYSKLLPEAEGRAFWLVSPSVKAALITMSAASGSVVWIANLADSSGGGAAKPLPINVFGLPVYVSQLPSSSLTSGDVYLIDPDNYALGTRMEIEIAVSEHVNFLSNLLTWRFLYRCDGQPRLNTYLTLANGDTVSPFQYLGALA